MAAVKPGSRWRSRVCTTEVVVVRAPAVDVELGCGGRPMTPRDDPSPLEGTPSPGADEGSLLGKRYVDEARGLELLCTHAGAGSLSVDDTVLVLKEAKPLPSSD